MRGDFDQPTAAPSWVMRIKHEQGPVDDLVQHADVEPLRLLLRPDAPGSRCLL